MSPTGGEWEFVNIESFYSFVRVTLVRGDEELLLDFNDFTYLNPRQAYVTGGRAPHLEAENYIDLFDKYEPLARIMM